MADTHIQINLDGSTEERKTVLWPSDKIGQEKVIRSLFTQKGWNVSYVNNEGGCFWKIKASCPTKSWNINLYISSIRDESRKSDEFKMQLGTTYPQNIEDGWLTVVLGIYALSVENNAYLLSGYDTKRYSFEGNPSIRGTRTKGLQKAWLYGMYKTDKSILFRPDLLYYYLENIDSIHNNCSNNFSTILEQTESIQYNIHTPYLSALRTKSFLLLAGISGTGKSRIVREFAFKSCPKCLQDKSGTTPGNYCMIEVKPNWHDSTELLGYYSRLGKAGYQFTKFVKFLVKAKMFPNVPFFVCLDEMNLAPVEQYFAEILSILETRKHPKNVETGEVDMETVKTEPIIDAQYFRELAEMPNVKNVQTGEPFSSNLTDRDIYLKLFGMMHEYLSKSKEERKKWIVCTFDDGYKSLTHDALEILKKQGFTATVFVCTGLIGKDNSWNNKDATLREHLDIKDINLLVKEGWEVASHGVFHKNLLKLNDVEIEYELLESKQSLNQLVGYCDTYAYPYGAYNKFIRRCVEKYYKYAFAVDKGGTSMVVDKHQLKRYSITEIYKMLKK